jgi:hypothetical protein
MAQVHHCPKLADPDQRRTLLLARPSLHHNPSRVVMADILPIFNNNKDMDCIARVVANTAPV